MLAEALHSADPNAPPWSTVTPEKQQEKARRAKRRLNQECADKMTVELLIQSDADSEITEWLRVLGTELT